MLLYELMNERMEAFEICTALNGNGLKFLAVLKRDGELSRQDVRLAGARAYPLRNSRRLREDAGVWIGGGAGEPTRRKEAIDKWLEDSRTKIATLERLIGATEKPRARGFFNKR